MLITFTDNDRSQKIDDSGFNKIGYVSQSRLVIYPRRHRLVREYLSIVEKLPHKCFPVPESLGVENVERFFTENFQALDLFNLGLSSILRNDIAYFARPLKLPRLSPIDDQIRNDRWVSMVPLITKGDLLFTFDTKSLLSRLISKVDRGPWSHSALCTGEGTIIEAITTGVCERTLDVYAASHYRTGLYRLRCGLPNEKDLLEFSRSKLVEPYSYRKAVIAGIQKLLRRPRTVPTPNDLAIQPDLELIAYV